VVYGRSLFAQLEPDEGQCGGVAFGQVVIDVPAGFGPLLFAGRGQLSDTHRLTVAASGHAVDSHERALSAGAYVTLFLFYLVQYFVLVHGHQVISRRKVHRFQLPSLP
jgi:hypothetical protein